MDGRKVYLKALLAEEKKKVAGLDFRKKLEYIWEYYRLWIIGVVCAVALLISFAVHFLYTPRENWFYGVFANTYAQVGEHSAFWDGFVEYAQLDTREKMWYLIITAILTLQRTVIINIITHLWHMWIQRQWIL